MDRQARNAAEYVLALYIRSPDARWKAGRPMILNLQPAQVATKSDDAESQLVFADGFLVAVLVRLSEQHGADAGKWFLEAGFGPVDPICPPTFADLAAARAWILLQLVSDA